MTRLDHGLKRTRAQLEREAGKSRMGEGTRGRRRNAAS